MEAYEGGGHAYHATMPTDALRGFRDTMNEMRAFGLERLQAAQWELGDKVRAMLAERGFRSVAAEGFEAPGVVVSYTGDAEVQTGRPFAEAGVQIAAGVPLHVRRGRGLPHVPHRPLRARQADGRGRQRRPAGARRSTRFWRAPRPERVATAPADAWRARRVSPAVWPPRPARMSARRSGARSCTPPAPRRRSAATGASPERQTRLKRSMTAARARTSRSRCAGVAAQHRLGAGVVRCVLRRDQRRHVVQRRVEALRADRRQHMRGLGDQRRAPRGQRARRPG